MNDLPKRLPLPTMSLRAAPEHHRLIRDIALALRTRPDLVEALRSVLQAPSEDALRMQDNVTHRLDELAARLERVDAAQRAAADHANSGIMEIWQYLDTVGKHMVETDARLGRLEASEPKPPASVEGSTPQPEEFASTASAPRRKSKRHTNV